MFWKVRSLARKLRAVQGWLARHREQVAFIWQEIRYLRYQGGMIEE